MIFFTMGKVLRPAFSHVYLIFFLLLFWAAKENYDKWTVDVSTCQYVSIHLVCLYIDDQQLYFPSFLIEFLLMKKINFDS